MMKKHPVEAFCLSVLAVLIALVVVNGQLFEVLHFVVANFVA